MAPALTLAGGRALCRAGELVLVTESQNHRMVGLGRDLCGSSSPTPLPKKVCRISHVFLLLCLVAGCQALAAVRQPAAASGPLGPAAIQVHKAGAVVCSELDAGRLSAQ